MKDKGNLWIIKRKSFVLFIAIAMLAVLVVSFFNIFKEEENILKEEYKPYDSMYNASRYFFRVYYPDDWDVEAGNYGFMKDPATGLVLEIFPLKKSAALTSATPSITPHSSSSTPADATLDPRAGMERDELFSMYVYYKEYEPIIDELEAMDSAVVDEILGSNEPEVIIQDSSGETVTTEAPKTNAKDIYTTNELVSTYVFSKFIEEKGESYSFYDVKDLKGDTIDFKMLPFEYFENDIRMTGELYVASRGMAYYEILVLGTNASFEKYDKVKNNIIHNIKFSVFDY